MRVTVASLMISALLLVPAAANAATITPNVFTDELDATNANCSLREAIAITNADSNATEPDCSITGTFTGGGTDTISLGGGTLYVLSKTGTDDSNVDGDLDVDTTTGSLIIDGLGSGQTAINTDVGWADRVLHQTAGTGALTLTDLRVAGGNISAGLGGGILTATGALLLNGVRVTGNHAQISGGVGHYASGSLSIVDSLVANNTANIQAGVTAGGTSAVIDSTVVRDNTTQPTSAGPGGGLSLTGSNVTATITDSLIADNDTIVTGVNPLGGGLFILIGMPGTPTVTVRNTTVSGNQLLNSVGMVLDGQGGGMRIDMTNDGVVNLVNSTVTGNRAEEMAGIDAFGNVASTLNIVHTTIGQNEATTTASAIRQITATVNLRGSVIDDAPGGPPACTGTITSLGLNVGSDATCGLTGSGDDPSADPMLGMLLPNGGQLAGPPGFLETVPTQEPALGSTVVEHVPQVNCTDVPMGALMVDQRLLGRPVDRDGNGIAECDAGSVEVQLPPPVVNPPVLTPLPAPIAQPAPKKKCKRKKNKRKRGDARKRKRCKKRK